MKLNMLLNEPLGASSAPFGVKMKCADFSSGSPASAALGAVGDMLYGIWNTYETNDSNERIARKTNESNERINQEQLAWAREQYNQEVLENRFLVDQAYQRELENRSHNEFYNSPSELARRLRAAGINPYLAMQGSGGSVGASQGHSIGAQTGSVPHMSSPNMIPMQQAHPAVPFPNGMFSRAAEFLYQLPFLEAKRDQEWVKVLSTSPLDPETKDRLIKMKLFAGDKAQKRYDLLQQEEFMSVVNDNAMKQMKLAIANEENEEKRKEWQRIAEKHSKEMSILTNEISRFIIEKQLLEDKHAFNEQSLKLIEKEVQRIGREEELWSGDFSFRNVFELLARIFTGSNIVSLLKMMQ